MDLSVSPVGRPTGGVNDLYAKMDARLLTSGMTEEGWDDEQGTGDWTALGAGGMDSVQECLLYLTLYGFFGYFPVVRTRPFTFFILVETGGM